MSDMTYCTAAKCPYEACVRHVSQAKGSYESYDWYKDCSNYKDLIDELLWVISDTDD